MAGRRRQTEGYMLADLCLSVSVLCCLTVILLYRPRSTSQAFHLFPDRYLRLQSEAILDSAYREVGLQDDAGVTVHFNGRGNVDQARTVTFTTSFSRRSVVIELGGGRLVFRDE